LRIHKLPQNRFLNWSPKYQLFTKQRQYGIVIRQMELNGDRAWLPRFAPLGRKRIVWGIPGMIMLISGREFDLDLDQLEAIALGGRRPEVQFEEMPKAGTHA
jgi:hypothetical protein